MSDLCPHRYIKAFRSEDGSLRMWACEDCKRRFYPACLVCVDVGHRNIDHPALIEGSDPASPEPNQEVGRTVDNRTERRHGGTSSPSGLPLDTAEAHEKLMCDCRTMEEHRTRWLAAPYPEASPAPATEPHSPYVRALIETYAQPATEPRSLSEPLDGQSRDALSRLVEEHALLRGPSHGPGGRYFEEGLCDVCKVAARLATDPSAPEQTDE